MAKFTVTNIKERVQRTFGDEADVQITEADIIRWINDGQREAVMQTEGLLETVISSNMTVNVQEYTVDPTIFALHRVRVRPSTTEPYFFIPWVSGVDFERMVDGWDQNQDRGIPSVYTEKEHKIYVFPIPDKTITNGIKYEGSKYPTDVTESASVHSLHEYYNQYLVDYCLLQAYELDEDFAAAESKGLAVQQTLEYHEGRENWYGRDKYPVIQQYDDMDG